MILAGMFIFLVILSHGQMTTANELKKLNEKLGVGSPPSTGLEYEYFVDTFTVSCAPRGSRCYYDGGAGFITGRDGAKDYADYLNTRRSDGWELLMIDGLVDYQKHQEPVFPSRAVPSTSTGAVE